MAITPTGAIFKTLNFDGTSLRSYGVYISGEATFNAPAREVEMISIPGRSGQLALDKGRFENIEVTYPAGIYADTEADFAEAVSELRNFLCSRSGYCRIEDDYNPNEFRMGIYKSGLEVTPALLKAGEFDLVFDCKPQRWLKSGEDKISVQDGDTITNPTLFEASPLLEIAGTGWIHINGEEIYLDNDVVGDAVIVDQSHIYGNYYGVTWTQNAIAGDHIDLDAANFGFVIKRKNESDYFTSYVVSNVSGALGILPSATSQDGSIVEVTASLDAQPTVYSFGTPSSNTLRFDLDVATNGGDTGHYRVEVTTSYDGNRELEIRANISVSPNNAFYIEDPQMSLNGFPSLVLHSSAATYGNPTYIDCDLGEAYAIEQIGGIDYYKPLNDYIALGANLPVLKPGSNTITFANTIASLKIVPRWWKI